MRLEKAMFPRSYREGGPFGLSHDQVRADDFVHNGGWYNKAGERLDFGDLSIADFRRISVGIPDGELFIVLDESDTWLRHFEGEKPDVEAPGVEYVAAKCCYIIAPLVVYLVDRFDSHRGNGTVPLRDALVARVLSTEKAREMILAAAK